MLKKLLALVLVVSVFLSPFPSYSSFAADGFEEILGYTEWSGEKIIDGTVYIDPLATLVIKKGTVVTFRNWSVMDIQGKLRIEGTVKEPVILQKDSNLPDTMYSLQISNQGEVMIRNTDISGGGSVAYQVYNKKQNIFFNTANAGSYTGVIHWQGGKSFVAENVAFHDNIAAVYIENQSPATKIQVHRSRFLNNEYDVLNVSTGSVDFRYNWWGDASGPQKRCTTCSTYEKISSTADIADWAKEEYTKDPVLVVPGVLGSAKKYGNWVLDPYLHAYDNLYNSLVSNGYTPEQNLFFFAYEWRNSNQESARALKQKIADIKAQAHWPKVDIVAHSMGGLVARQYEESAEYVDDIDQLITIGTPQNGSPESYATWEGGELLDFTGFILKSILKQEAEEQGFNNLFDYIRKRPVSSIQELLPVYSYLYDIDADMQLREYPHNYPRNNFLEALNNPVSVEKLQKVELTKIVGLLDYDKSTRTGFEVIDASMGDFWEHGYPLGFEIPVLREQHIRRGLGDITVPLDSARSENIPAEYLIALNAAHTDLPTEAQKEVFHTLTGRLPSKEVRKSLVTNMLMISVYSPVDIQVISPSNKRVGKNFEGDGAIYDEIPGAYYTGYDTQNEFITIPNPEDGEYTILTQGTGAGEYRIEAVKITEGTTPTDDAKESLVTFTGTASPDVTEEKKIELLPDDTVVSKEDQDSLPPTTDISLSGTQGTNGWYIGDVTITLFAQDNENGSGVEKTEYSIDNGATWSVYTESLTRSQEGITTLQYFSTDKQGNREAAKTLSVKIDKTAPEAKMVFDPDTERLVITGTDNISQTVSVKTIELRSSPWMGFENSFSWLQNPFQKKLTTTTLLDEAGHKTQITFENRKKSPKYRIDIRLQSLSYDGVNTPLPETSLRYQWQRDSKKQYRSFIAYIDTDTESLVSHYSPKYDETLLTKQSKGSDTSSMTKEKLPGMIVPGILTEQGKIHPVY